MVRVTREGTSGKEGNIDQGCTGQRFFASGQGGAEEQFLGWGGQGAKSLGQGRSTVKPYRGGTKLIILILFKNYHIKLKILEKC